MYAYLETVTDMYYSHISSIVFHLLLTESIADTRSSGTLPILSVAKAAFSFESLDGAPLGLAPLAFLSILSSFSHFLCNLF